MRKQKFLIALVVGVFATFLMGCGKEPLVSSPEFDPRNPEEYEFAGQLHNEGLDFIYHGLKERFPVFDTSLATSVAVVEAVNELTIDFAHQTDFTDEEKKIFIESASEILEITTPLLFDGGNTENIFEEFLFQMLDEMHDLPQEIHALRDRIGGLVNRAGTGIHFERAIASLNLELLEQLSDNNTLALAFSMTSVAKHSYQYWSENLKKWGEIFGLDEDDLSEVFFSSNKGSTRKLVEADVGGAVGVGFASFVAGGFAGAAIGAAGGGIGSSAQASLEPFFDWLWGETLTCEKIAPQYCN